MLSRPTPKKATKRRVESSAHLGSAQNVDLQHVRHLDFPRSRRSGCREIPFGELGCEQPKPE